MENQQTDLLSNTLMEGTNPPDVNLKNPWGIARGTGAPWWVSDNAAGVSTLYNGAGTKQSLTVTGSNVGKNQLDEITRSNWLCGFGGLSGTTQRQLLIYRD